MALPTLLSAGLLAAASFAPDLSTQEILISGGTVVTSEGRFDADVRVLQDARNRGLSVFVETRPIYLHFTRERFEEPDRGLYVAYPPLRGQRDQDALWAGSGELLRRGRWQAP